MPQALQAGDPAYNMADALDVVIVGAGHAGLAIAAALKHQYKDQVKLVVLEGSSRIGNSWYKRYNRLHLHTPKSTSSLPYLPMPTSYPTYVSKDQVRDYLEIYAKQLELPVLLRHHVSSVTYDAAAQQYKVTVQVWQQGGDASDKGGYTAPQQSAAISKMLIAKCVVMAVGPETMPFVPELPGRTSFKGPLLHSADYKDGKAFAGKNVLVVGFGNSAGEIALCLSEHGARPTILIRRKTVVCIGRDDGLVSASLIKVFHQKRQLKSWHWILDKIMDPVIIAPIPNLRPYGVPQVVPAYFGNPGVLEHNIHNFEPPSIDIGQCAAIKKGAIKVLRGELRGYTAAGALVAAPDGDRWAAEKEHSCDAIVLCTGYNHTGSLQRVLSPELFNSVLGSKQRPISGEESRNPGLYVLGFDDLIGRIAMIGEEAKDISACIGKRLGIAA